MGGGGLKGELGRGCFGKDVAYAGGREGGNEEESEGGMTIASTQERQNITKNNAVALAESFEPLSFQCNTLRHRCRCCCFLINPSPP